jgi:hypothetical protein
VAGVNYPGRPHGGQTAELLKDLRSAVERF